MLFLHRWSQILCRPMIMGYRNLLFKKFYFIQGLRIFLFNLLLIHNFPYNYIFADDFIVRYIFYTMETIEEFVKYLYRYSTKRLKTEENGGFWPYRVNYTVIRCNIKKEKSKIGKNTKKNKEKISK